MIKTCRQQRAWEPPELTVVALGATAAQRAPSAQATKCNTGVLGTDELPGMPPVPPAPLSKLGFSLELAFPLAFHSGS
jgi:hypothetical protein